MNLLGHPSARVAAALATAALLTGCSGESIAERLTEEAVGRAGGGNVDIDTDTGSLSFDSDEGSFNIGSQDVPDELPDEFPLPGGAVVMGSMSQSNDDGVDVGLQAQLEESFDEAVAYFDAELEASGWTVSETNTMNMGGLKTQVWGVEGYGFEGQVSVTQLGEDEEDGMIVAVSVNLRSQGE